MQMLLLQTKKFKVVKVEGDIAYIISPQIIGMTNDQANAFLKKMGYKPAVDDPADDVPAVLLVEDDSGVAIPSYLYYHR